MNGVKLGDTARLNCSFCSAVVFTGRVKTSDWKILAKPVEGGKNYSLNASSAVFINKCLGFKQKFIETDAEDKGLG